MSSDDDRASANPYQASNHVTNIMSSWLPVSLAAGAIAGAVTGGAIVRSVALSEDWLVGGRPMTLSTLGECFYFAQGGAVWGIAATTAVALIGRCVSSPRSVLLIAVPLGIVVGGMSSFFGYCALSVILFGGTASEAYFCPRSPQHHGTDR